MTSTYADRHSWGALAVRDVQHMGRVLLGDRRLDVARERALDMASRVAVEYPEACAEYVRHATSAVRALEFELREIERDKTAGIVAGLRRR